MVDPVRKNIAFTGYQKFVVGTLAFLQFTIILDFMILSPLGAILMPALKISASEFGLVVSAYAFSAGISGLLAAGFADKFDRKKLLLFFYVGFILGTLFCGLAPTFPLLMAARMATGLFGGVMGSIIFAITTDLFSYDMRGRVMGFIQTAFAGSQVLGIPAGLYLANHWGWHVPFYMISLVSALVGVAIWIYLKPIDAHLKMHPDRSAVHHLMTTLSQPKYLQAFLTTTLLSTGGFMLMPFASAYSVNNLGINLHQLPVVYLVTGLASMVIGPVVGKMSDVMGKYRMFCFGSVVSIVMVFVYTHLAITPLSLVILVNTLMFIGIFSRMIPAQALMSAIPEATSRGSFMSINSAVQQFAGGIASVLAGLLVATSATGKILHFDRLGYVVIAASACSVVMMYFIHLRVLNNLKSLQRPSLIDSLADGNLDSPAVVKSNLGSSNPGNP